MTSLPAQTFKAKNKGLLKEGFDADIVIFDPAKILDGSTFENPMQAPEGIILVLVNGQVALKDGDITGVSSEKTLIKNDLKIWLNGNLIPWQEATVPLLSHGFSRASAIFEVFGTHVGSRKTMAYWGEEAVIQPVLDAPLEVS